ncbi:nitrate ABC transporter substrate-binding protein [Candidatus Parcubacteria bacterium]|nr:nitrate ABC transporter substrate-binding protein [Candidatus Parcubacteria bacterium]
MKRVLGVVVALCVASVAAAQPSYAQPVPFVQAPPLIQMSPPPVVGTVKPGPRKVGVITWGADLEAIYANGNSKTTAKGSIFDREGLSLVLFREDDFTKQLRMYLAGDTPFLRGTVGQIAMAAEIAARDPRTELVIIEQRSWSRGGDVIVVKDDIKTSKDLKGKIIAVQAYAPQVEFLFKVLADAGLSPKDVTVKWTRDLTKSDQDPGTALRKDPTVRAAAVISPDAMELTSQGTVGSGGERSVKGAKILLSTKSADHIIADVYAVRRDFYEANRGEIEKFVHGLMLAHEGARNLIAEKARQAAAYKTFMTAGAMILLDKPEIAEAEGMYADADLVGYRGNVAFFTSSTNPRNLQRVIGEVQSAFITMGLITKKVPIQAAQLDYKQLAAGLADTTGVEVPRFDPKEVAKVVDTRQKQGTLAEGELFPSFEVYFQPNQNTFPVEQYAEAFKRVAELASTYGGAVITVEGHADPLNYLQRKSKQATERELTEVAQAAKNLSYTRANGVRQSLISYAKGRGISIDANQFTVIGHGVMRPKNGLCGADPCAPRTEQEWRANMRVEFRIIRVEAEAAVFAPVSK